MFSAKFEELVQSLRLLPGVGPKSAQRMALHLLTRNRSGGRQLAHAPDDAMLSIHQCSQCRSLSESEVCTLCLSTHREPGLLCVVESASDVVAIESSGGYRGRYFVLGGHLSPLDGIGPDALGIPLLLSRLQHEAIDEVILATNATMEGQATAHYLGEAIRQLPRDIRLSRIAQGVPQGGELEYINGHTISQALQSRQPLQ